MILSVLAQQLKVAADNDDLDTLKRLINNLTEQIDLVTELQMTTPVTISTAMDAWREGVCYVRFKNPNSDLFEWAENGMIAKLTGCDWDGECYILTFDTTGFESINYPLMPDVCYPNAITRREVNKNNLPEKEWYTAIEAGVHDPIIKAYWTVIDPKTNHEMTTATTSDVLESLVLDNILEFITV